MVTRPTTNLLGEEYMDRADIPVIGLTAEQLAAMQRCVIWFDERQVCRHVLKVVAGGREPEPSRCWFYAAGRCGMYSRGIKECALMHRADPVWEKAQDWRFVEGLGAVHRSLWAQFGLTEDPGRAPNGNGRK